MIAVVIKIVDLGSILIRGIVAAGTCGYSCYGIDVTIAEE